MFTIDILPCLLNKFSQQRIIRAAFLLALLVVTIVSTACTPTATAGEGTAPTLNQLQTHVETIPVDEGEPVQIEGGSADLTTTEDAAMMRFQTSELEPGHVYTAWWIIINQPEACSASPCSPEDVLENTDLAGVEITRADGIIADENGMGEFTGYLVKGEVDKPWFGNGFTHPNSAEIHIVINHHGPLIPETAADMLTSYRGGCSDDSLPPPFPDTAKADGVPGPNECQLVQDAIFQQ